MIRTNLMIAVHKADGEYNLSVFRSSRTGIGLYYYQDHIGYHLIQPDDMDRMYIPPGVY